MGSLLLLDTSALLTLWDDEPGAERVEQAFELPGSCYACFLSRNGGALPRLERRERVCRSPGL